MEYIMPYKIFENTDSDSLKFTRQKQDLITHVKYLYIFYEDSEIIASADIYQWYSKPDIWVVSNLYTTEEYRKKGLAKQILTLLEKVVYDEFEGRDFRLWVLKDSWMKKWYESLGFEYVKDKDEENIWMRKEL